MRTVLLPNIGYTLSLDSGPWQPIRTNLKNFPICAYFSIEMSIVSLPNIPIIRCSSFAKLPTDLNSPQFLGTSNRVHFQDSFLVPRPES